MYENLMTQIGPSSWSDNFSHPEFFHNGDLNYLNWSKDFQPGYMFRNLGNQDVYFNPQIIRLLQNYRSVYMQLAVTYYLDHQKELRKSNKNTEKISQLKKKTLDVLNRMRINIPERTIPITTEELHYQVGENV